MVQSSSAASLRFKKLADNLCALNKISSKIADNAEFEYNSECSYKEAPMIQGRKGWMFFLGNMFGLSLRIFGIFAKQSSFFSHGQSFVERGFSVNKLTIDDNMQNKSIVSQRLIYDRMKLEDCPVSEFTISGDLQKSCLLASQRYKSDLEKINSDKKNADISHRSEALSCRI